MRPKKSFVFSAGFASCFAFFALKISRHIFNVEYAEVMRPKPAISPGYFLNAETAEHAEKIIGFVVP